MSRCFPYRPTLCARNGARGEEALIETIKLHCKKDKYKTESFNEKRRERKEKRKEKKEKDVKPYGFSDGKVKKHNNVKCSQEEKIGSLLGEHVSKRSEDEEHSEKSGLTDEHDEPVCYLSDGTQNSNKRKRQPSQSIAVSTTTSITVQKNVLRIRLPSLKHRISDPSLSKGQSCPVGRVADSPGPQLGDKEQCQLKNKVEEVSPMSDFSRKESIDQFDACTCNGSSTEKVPGTETFYQALIEDWVTPPFRSWQNDSDNEDWLFGTKQQSQEFKRLKAGNHMPCRQSSSLWPCAHHLLDVDIYALPYSIPF